MADASDYDLCVIGGGINGAGIARDAAGRGMSVLLVEAGDLGGATSSASTKLIHGGLRYLEYFEFGLVREALQEREVLLNLAPHIIRPMEFILPHDQGQRPYWMIRIGLFLYDHLAPRSILPGSKGINLQSHIYGVPLKSDFKKAFSYADCWVEDARLVVLNALSAKEHRAEVLTRTPCTKLSSEGDHWLVSLEGDRKIKARMVVNATGPWVREFLEQSSLTTPDVPNVRLVKGSHIVIKKAFEGDQAYIVQQPDGRVVFAIPYEKDFTLVGTTEEAFSDNPKEAKISKKEIEYLCAAFNQAFKQKISKKDVVWSFSGVRPLFDDDSSRDSAVSRDYHLHVHRGSKAPMISVFGGKITTYRRLAQEVVDKLTKKKNHWTDQESLPGGGILHKNFETFVQSQAQKYDWLPGELLQHYARQYGTRMDKILAHVKSLEDLGHHFGNSLYEAEVEYLIDNEWARSAEDILWRRTKLGLHVSKKTAQALQERMNDAVSD